MSESIIINLPLGRRRKIECIRDVPKTFYVRSGYLLYSVGLTHRLRAVAQILKKTQNTQRNIYDGALFSTIVVNHGYFS